MKTTILHNPRCSKSETLQLLEEQGEEIEIVRYLEDTPTQEELKNILKLLKINRLHWFEPKKLSERKL